jgi:hypothetical protein
MYKAEELPVRVRLYAAAKAVEFESDKSVRTLEDIKEQVRREMASEGEGSLERLVDEIKRHRKVIIEARDQQLRAWVDSGQLNQSRLRLCAGCGPMWTKTPRFTLTIWRCRMADGVMGTVSGI